MHRSVFFRRILALLLLALFLWTILTAAIYAVLSKPVFTRIKVDELMPRARTVATIATASFLQEDPYFDNVLRSAFELFDAWIFVVDGLSGEVRNTSIPEDVRVSEQDMHELIEQNLDALLSGHSDSQWFTRRVRGDDELLFIGVPITLRFGQEPRVVGAVYFVKPLEELGLGLRNLNIALVVSSLIVLALMTLPTYWATARLIRPLRQTRDVALAMTEGDFSVRADTRSQGEIGELAYTMNHLAAELDSSISALTLERNRLRQILEGMGEGLIAIDAAYEITQSNRAALRLLGRSENGSRQDLMHAEPKIAAAFARTLENKERVETILERANGRKLLLSTVPLEGSRKKTAGAVALLRDITESEHLEQTRRDYVANISHELRTPLTSMQALLEPLSDNLVQSEKDRQRYYSILLRETKRLSHLIDDTLELSRLQAKSEPLPMQQFYLQDVLSDLKLKYDMTLAEHDLTLQLPPNLAHCPPAYASPERVEQVLVILLDNAAKFSLPGGVIRILLDWDEATLLVKVCDQGIGIEPEDLEHVFDRFYKVDKAHREPGTGLGLSIAREVLDWMGQTIFVESQPQKGSTFTFTLDRHRGQEPRQA